MVQWDKVVKGFIAFAGAATSYLFGGWGVLIQSLVALAVLDVITGWIASSIEARKGEGQGLKSSIGRERIPLKVLMFCVIAAAHMADMLLGKGDMIRDASLWFYCANELLSNVENVGRAGGPVPGVVKDIVAVLKNRGGASS